MLSKCTNISILHNECIEKHYSNNIYITTLTNEVVSIRKKSVQSVHIHKHTLQIHEPHSHKLLSSKTYDVTAYQDNTNCSFGGNSNTYDN